MAVIHECIVFQCEDPAHPFPIAKFALDGNGDGHFIYGESYLARDDSFSIDPWHLPLYEYQQSIPRRKDGAYGVLADAGPDSWGVKLTSSILRKKKSPIPATPVEWFLMSWHHGAGCLGFSPSPDAQPRVGTEPIPVSELTRRLADTIAVLAVEPDTELDAEAVRLLYPGGSLGGVRPKTVVMLEGREYIAKFSRQDDRFNVPTVEYATLRLAHNAGVILPDFELLDIANRSVLVLARFDRTANGKRRHYVSANTIINIDSISADHREYRAGYSYAGIAEASRSKSSHGVADSHQLFRRMVLNILVGNVDDHMRNHAFLMNADATFELSPAFDIVPHMDAMSLPQSIGVGAAGTASTISNALSQCGRFLLKPQEAQAIVGEVREAVSKWKQVFKESGVSRSDIHTLTPSFHAADQAESIGVAFNAKGSP